MKIPNSILEAASRTFVESLIKEKSLDRTELMVRFSEHFMYTALKIANDEELSRMGQPSPYLYYEMGRPLVDLLATLDLEKAKDNGVWTQEEHPIETLAMIIGSALAQGLDVVLEEVKLFDEESPCAGGTH